MIAREQLEAANKKGLIGKDQIDPLWSFLNDAEVHSGDLVDPEEMHFARGFHDIFISIGICILFAGYFVGLFQIGDQPSFLLAGLVGAFALNWLLAEWFCKKLRLSLPSMLLAAGFIGSTILLSAFFTGGWDDGASGLSALSWGSVLPLVCGLIAGGLFHRRFGVPVTPALMAATGVGLFLLIVALINEALLDQYLTIWLFMAGLACLALALWFDTQDPERLSSKSDKAFWLHLLAAPMLVHAVLSQFGFDAQPALSAILLIMLVVLIGLFALVIDRRAFLASAIGYLGFAIAILLKEIELGEAGVASLTLLVLGAFVLMLGSGWSTLRGWVLRPFETSPMLRNLPPIPPKG